MEISPNKPFDDKNIQKFFAQIEKLKLMINQKEDDLKNEINEKEITIKKMNEKLLEQENKIKNNEKEIKKLNDIIKDLKEKNEKDLEERDNDIKIINNKLLNQEEDVKIIKQLNKKMENINNRLLREEEKEIEERNKKFKLNEEIYMNNKNNMRKQLHYFHGIIYFELCALNELERYDGILSSIGIKLLMTKKFDELEGIIKAPKNSLYKNGIFNFVIKFYGDYPRDRPYINMKTKIFHTEVLNSDGRCCIKFLNYWDEKTDLSMILIGLYQFFFCNNDNGYEGEITKIYRRKDYTLFKQKCQEYIKLYSFNMLDDKLEYLIQNCYYDIRNDDTYYKFLNVLWAPKLPKDRFNFRRKINIQKEEMEINCKDDIIKILNKRFGILNFTDKVLIADNKIYFSFNEIKEMENLPENHTIIIAPKLIQSQNDNIKNI